MILKNLIDEDFVNYKKCNMFLIFPYCSFKCDKENGNQYCQNWSLTKEPDIEVDDDQIIDRYITNPLTSALVCGGLEPLDSWEELYPFLCKFRLACPNDDIIIYTGYTEEELHKFDLYMPLLQLDNCFVKVGRFRPGQKPHYDEILGVNLANDEQYTISLTKRGI